MTVFVSSTGGGGSSSSSLTTRLANDGFVIMGACIFGIIMSETAIGPAVGLALAIADLLQYRAGVKPPVQNPTVSQYNKQHKNQTQTAYGSNTFTLMHG